jgi:subtilisin family serine protease
LLSVIVPAHCYLAFLDAAALIPAIVSVSHREQFTTRNRWARGLVQSHSRPASPPQIDATFWQSNITGSGQIVAIGDTGVDTNLGFFYDEVSVPFCTSSPSTCYNLPPHRRFKAYIQLNGGDKRDDDGHGSHTTASLAGNAKCSDAAVQADQQLYNGMAPDAKLVFSDISNDETLGGLPDDLSTDYFPLPFSLGARIRSDSWGTSDAFYTESARYFDVFSFKNDEFLPLIAAGNDGDSGFFTVGAPATAKNCIAVGATGNAAASYLYLSDRDMGMRIDAPASPSCAYVPSRPPIAAHPAGFGPKISEGAFQGLQIVVSSPVDACSPLVGSQYSGKVVLIVRGQCTFVEKVRAASVAGAAGAVIYNNVGGIIRMGGVGDDIRIPSVSIIKEMGTLIEVSLSLFYLLLPPIN